MTDGMFRDFIPEGEDTNGQGNGFVDYVPAKEPIKQPEPVKQPVKEAPKPAATK